MKFKMQATDGKQTWWEDYNKPEVTDQQSAERYAARMVEYFNSTLRPDEKPRTLLSVVFGEGKAKEKHDWQKLNLMTLSDNRGRTYDQMRCATCGVTGKRRGVDEGVMLDSEYRAKAFQACDTARALKAKRRAAKASTVPETESSQ